MTTPARGSGKRTGRPPGSPPNRETILASARRSFMERGYDGATIRGIASAAGVDAALVHHYFGTKDELLLASLQPTGPDRLPELLAPGIEGLGERVLRATLEAYDAAYPSGWGTMIGLIRSAATHEDAARLLRESFVRGGIVRLVEALEVSQPRLRAALVASDLFGLAMARFVVRLEPIASAAPGSIIAWYAPSLQRSLAGPLPGDDGVMADDAGFDPFR